MNKGKAQFQTLVYEVTSRGFLNTQKIRKVLAWVRAYVQAHYVLESTDELDCQSGGITVARNAIYFSSDHGGVVTLQEIEAVMKFLKYR